MLKKNWIFNEYFWPEIDIDILKTVYFINPSFSIEIIIQY